MLAGSEFLCPKVNCLSYFYAGYKEPLDAGIEQAKKVKYSHLELKVKVGGT